MNIAKSQLGYKESEKNFIIDESEGDAKTKAFYTRYGSWYGENA